MTTWRHDGGGTSNYNRVAEQKRVASLYLQSLGWPENQIQHKLKELWPLYVQDHQRGSFAAFVKNAIEVR